MQDWYSFKGETKEFYGIDMSVLEVSCLSEWGATKRGEGHRNELWFICVKTLRFVQHSSTVQALAVAFLERRVFWSTVNYHRHDFTLRLPFAWLCYDKWVTQMVTACVNDIHSIHPLLY